MAISPRRINYGLNDGKIWVKTASGYGSAIDIPGIRSVSATTDATSDIVRGDGTVIAVLTTDRSASGSLEMAGMNPACMAALTGSEAISAGSLLTAAVHYFQSAELYLPYLQGAFLVPVQSSDGGMDQLIIPSFKASSGPGLTFAEDTNMPSVDFDIMSWAEDDTDKKIFYVWSQYADPAHVLPTTAMTALPTGA